MSDLQKAPTPITQSEYWPVYAEQQDPKASIRFWERKEKSTKHLNILIEGKLFRIGKSKTQPQEYYFTLYDTGLLTYQNNKKSNKIKGCLMLRLNIYLKLVDLKKSTTATENSPDEDVIKAYRIRRYLNNFIYVWNNNYDLTYRWGRLMARFCINQNFDVIYRLGDVIGKGGFAKVFKVFPHCRQDFQSEEYAAKVYSKELLISKGEMKKFKTFIQNECNLLRSIDNPFVMKITEVIQLEDVIILISDFIPHGTLYSLLRSQILLDYATAKEIIYQLSLAVKAVHDKQYVHRDIKLENVMVSSVKPLKIKLIDFGFAEKIDRKYLRSGQGTAGYIAPEIFDLQPYSEKSDVFSIGVIMFALLAGYSPFKSDTYEGLLNQNKLCNIVYKDQTWKNISSQSKSLVSSMLDIDPQNRISLEQLLLCLDNNQQPSSTLVNTKRIPTQKPQYIQQKQIEDFDDGGENILSESMEYNVFQNKIQYQQDSNIIISELGRPKSCTIIFTRRSMKSFFQKSLPSKSKDFSENKNKSDAVSSRNIVLSKKPQDPCQQMKSLIVNGIKFAGMDQSLLISNGAQTEREKTPSQRQIAQLKPSQCQQNVTQRKVPANSQFFKSSIMENGILIVFVKLKDTSFHEEQCLSSDLELPIQQQHIKSLFQSQKIFNSSKMVQLPQKFI